MIRRRDFLCGLIGAAGLAALPWESASACTCRTPRLMVLCGKFVPLNHESTCPLAGALPRKRMSYADFCREQQKKRKALYGGSLEDVCHNWWAHRESTRQLAEAGYEINHFALAAVDDRGFRHVTVRMADGTEIEYLAAWTLVTHQRENKHWGSIVLPCDDCGTRPMGQHDWRCKHSTALAHHLRGDWSAYRVIS
jgi:hypothetical protein